MNIHKKPSKEQFVLMEMKSVSRDSVDFKGKVSIADGAETYNIPYSGPYPIIPHPDLFKHLDQLKTRLASYFGYTLFATLVSDSKFKASKAQEKYVEEFMQELFNDIKVTGFSYSGKERKAIIVKGTYNGSSINTKPLHFTNQEYGEDMKEICNSVCDEMYEYIFEGKKAQMDIFDGEED